MKLELLTVRKISKLKFPDHYGIIANGILDTKGKIFLAGEGEIGKSTMSLEMALRLRTGSLFIGKTTAKVDGILILQTENNLPVIKDRINKMKKGMGLKKLPSKIYFSNPKDTFKIENGKDVSRIITVINNSNISILIIDPFIDSHRSNENSNTEMRKVLNILDSIRHQTDVAIVIVHHFTKSGDRSGKYRLRGASTIYDWADTIIELSRGRNANERVVKFLKLRNGPPIQNINLRLNKFLLHEVVADKSKCTTDEVVKVLKKQFSGNCKKKGDLVASLCKTTKCSPKTASNAIRKAVLKGKIQESMNGKSKRIEQI